MKIFDPAIMFRGWFVGEFEPTAYHTTNFEVGILEHKKDEIWQAHYHEHCDEINFLLEGEMTLNEEKLVAPIIFVIGKGEIANPKFLTDCKLVVIKTPCVPGDKIIVDV